MKKGKSSLRLGYMFRQLSICGLLTPGILIGSEVRRREQIRGIKIDEEKI
jgi:hypothetical protein